MKVADRLDYECCCLNYSSISLGVETENVNRGPDLRPTAVRW